MTLTREELALTIDEAEWADLRPHLERGVIILVDDKLDLADTAYKVAVDDVENVHCWVESGMIGKPDESRIRNWDDNKLKKFAMLIVSPYVLIQEKMPTFH